MRTLRTTFLSLVVMLAWGSLCAARPPDLDDDGDVDLADYLVFHSCFGEPGLTASPDCSAADLDEDGDVDQADVDWYDTPGNLGACP